MAAWSTYDEVKFIEKLGCHSDLKVCPFDLLNGYRTALDRRISPGELDIAKLKAICDRKIAAATSAGK